MINIIQIDRECLQRYNGYQLAVYEWRNDRFCMHLMSFKRKYENYIVQGEIEKGTSWYSMEASNRSDLKHGRFSFFPFIVSISSIAQTQLFIFHNVRIYLL